VRVVPKQIAYITNWTSLATKFTPSCRSPSKKKNKKKTRLVQNYMFSVFSALTYNVKVNENYTKNTCRVSVCF